MLVPLALTLACASTPAPAPASPQPQSDELVTWQPGDSEPLEREVQRWGEPPPTDAAVVPVNFFVEIRNRCAQPAQFVVGPDVDAPPDDAPINTLAPGEAISTSISGADKVYLKDAAGGFSQSEGASKNLVFIGDDACEQIKTDKDDLT